MEKARQFIREIKHKYDVLRPLKTILWDKKLTYGDLLWDYEEREECPDEEYVAGVLLLKDAVFLGLERDENDRITINTGCFIAVPCTTLFGIAPFKQDNEKVPYFDLDNILKIYLAHGHLGLKKWVCLRRNKRPNDEYVEKLKEAGLWDEIMEELDE